MLANSHMLGAQLNRRMYDVPSINTLFHWPGLTLESFYCHGQKHEFSHSLERATGNLGISHCSVLLIPVHLGKRDRIPTGAITTGGTAGTVGTKDII